MSYIAYTKDEMNINAFEEAMRELEIGNDDISDLAGNIDFALDLYSDPEANLEYKNDLLLRDVSMLELLHKVKDLR